MASNKVLCQILEPYGKPYSFMDAVLQKAKVIFGNPDENDGYAHFLKEDLEKSGHHAILSFTTCKEIMQNLDNIIISDKILRRKEAKVEGLAQADKVHFVKQWKEDHGNQLP